MIHWWCGIIIVHYVYLNSSFRCLYLNPVRQEVLKTFCTERLCSEVQPRTFYRPNTELYQNAKIKKSPKKYYPCIHFLVPLFKRLGIILLDYYTVLLCNKKIGTFADMDTDPIVSPPPPPHPRCLRCKFLAEMPPGLISQSLTIYRARQFYLSSDTRQHTNPKPFSSIGSKVRPQLKPLKMHCNTSKCI